MKVYESSRPLSVLFAPSGLQLSQAVRRAARTTLLLMGSASLFACVDAAQTANDNNLVTDVGFADGGVDEPDVGFREDLGDIDAQVDAGVDTGVDVGVDTGVDTGVVDVGMPTGSFGTTGSGGQATSSNFRLQIRMGAPQPTGVGASPNFRIVLDPSKQR